MVGCSTQALLPELAAQCNGAIPYWNGGYNNSANMVVGTMYIHV